MDLVILDLNLPSMEWYCKFVAEIRKICKKIPILMLTAKRFDESESVIGLADRRRPTMSQPPFSPLTLIARIKALKRRWLNLTLERI